MNINQPKHPVTSGGSWGAMSGENPMHPAAVTANHENLVKTLKSMGLKHDETHGRYGSPERSVIIYNPRLDQMKTLGKLFGQDSVIHSVGGKHELHFTNGPNEGKVVGTQLGAPAHEWFENPPENDYTHIPRNGYFRINFDFDSLNKSGKSIFARLKKAWPKNEQENQQAKRDLSAHHRMAQGAPPHERCECEHCESWRAQNQKALTEGVPDVSGIPPSNPIADKHAAYAQDYQNVGGTFAGTWKQVNGQIQKVPLYGAGEEGVPAPDRKAWARSPLSKLKKALPKGAKLDTNNRGDQTQNAENRKGFPGSAEHMVMEDAGGGPQVRGIQPVVPGQPQSVAGQLVALDPVTSNPKSHVGHKLIRYGDAKVANEELDIARGWSEQDRDSPDDYWHPTINQPANYGSTISGPNDPNVNNRWDTRNDKAFWSHPNFYEWHDGHTDHNGGSPWNKQTAVDTARSLGLMKADAAHPHMDAPPKNEQAVGVGAPRYAEFAGPYGQIKPGSNSNLLHYDLKDKLKDTNDLVKRHGFQVYYAGGKHGKPDLVNRNYNTNHLMIYDPTPASGGDFGERDYTDTWRQLHELSHALTLPELNQTYGEGRRIGKLGTHRTMNEAMRAVHWEHLAAHKQRDLSKQIGIHIPDDVFNKEYNCLDEETEALTKRGWVKGFELRPNDVLLTKNPHSEALEWQGLVDLRLFTDYSGELVTIKSKTFHSVSTPNHRWLVTTNQGVVRERTTDTLVSRGDRIHRTGHYELSATSSLTPDEAELLGWFVTDGTYKRRPNAKKRTSNTYETPGIYAQLCQSTTANSAKCARIEALVQRLDKDGQVCRPKSVNGIQTWTLGPKLTKILLDFAPKRSLELSTVLLLDREALLRLEEAMILGDGTKNRLHGQVSLVTGRQSQAEAFQVVLTLLGRASTSKWRDTSGNVSTLKNGHVIKSDGCWTVTELRRQHVQVYDKHFSRQKVTNAKVWCPVIPNTFFVARREGKVWITGNTVMHDAVHRAVTGQFTEPSQEGFVPHSHQVPLTTALDMVRNEGKRLGLQGHHELVARKSEPKIVMFKKALPKGAKLTPDASGNSPANMQAANEHAVMTDQLLEQGKEVQPDQTLGLSNKTVYPKGVSSHAGTATLHRERAASIFNNDKEIDDGWNPSIREPASLSPFAPIDNPTREKAFWGHPNLMSGKDLPTGVPTPDKEAWARSPLFNRKK